MAINLEKKAVLTKTDLIKKTAEDVGLSQGSTGIVVNAFLDEICKGVKKGMNIAIMDFGSFKIQKVKARKGRNIHTGEMIKIPAHKRVKFSPGKKLSESVSRKK